MIAVKETQAKSVLNKSAIHDYCLNPYTGCQVGCLYCYARLFICRYTGHKEPWGQFVDTKVNAPEVLRRQLQRAKRGTVWVSSVCDPYQPLEARYRLTRRCLEELRAVQFPVNVQTKSNLALRDLDLFSQFDDIEVGFTITTEDEHTARLFEPQASTVSQRIAALDAIRARGVQTFAFLGPLLPGNPERLAELVAGKVEHVLIDRMNYVPMVKSVYLKHGLGRFIEDAFFAEQRERLARELKKRDVPFELLF